MGLRDSGTNQLTKVSPCKVGLSQHSSHPTAWSPEWSFTVQTCVALCSHNSAIAARQYFQLLHEPLYLLLKAKEYAWHLNYNWCGSSIFELQLFKALNLQSEYLLLVLGSISDQRPWASFISAEVVITKQLKTESSNHSAFLYHRVSFVRVIFISHYPAHCLIK